MSPNYIMVFGLSVILQKSGSKVRLWRRRGCHLILITRGQTNTLLQKATHVHFLYYKFFFGPDTKTDRYEMAFVLLMEKKFILWEIIANFYKRWERSWPSHQMYICFIWRLRLNSLLFKKSPILNRTRLFPTNHNYFYGWSLNIEQPCTWMVTTCGRLESEAVK